MFVKKLICSSLNFTFKWGKRVANCKIIRAGQVKLKINFFKVYSFEFFQKLT
jgi:uncharacterized beta-barrel protein YwiB (DUF1934 family)